MRTKKWNWIQTEPGTLILDGTPYRIVYDGRNPKFPFIIWQDQRQIHVSMTLISAKMIVQNHAEELNEMRLL